MGNHVEYRKDNRPNADQYVPLSEFAELANNHFDHMQERAQQSLMPLVVEHSAAIYATIQANKDQSKLSAIKLARAGRLQHLAQMLTESNIIDFMFIKWPAWWANDKIERRKERRMTNV